MNNAKVSWRYAAWQNIGNNDVHYMIRECANSIALKRSKLNKKGTAWESKKLCLVVIGGLERRKGEF